MYRFITESDVHIISKHQNDLPYLLDMIDSLIAHEFNKAYELGYEEGITVIKDDLI